MVQQTLIQCGLLQIPHDYGNKGSGPLNVTGRNNYTLTGLDAYREYKIEIYQGNDLGMDLK